MKTRNFNVNLMGDTNLFVDMYYNFSAPLATLDQLACLAYEEKPGYYDSVLEAKQEIDKCGYYGTWRRCYMALE